MYVFAKYDLHFALLGVVILICQKKGHFMKYEEALERLAELNKRGIHPGLAGIRKLLGALGSPEKGLKVIHVVGTNGKGSTAPFISEMLKAAGYKCGLYSSPAVFDDREIIKVDPAIIKNINDKINL